MTQEEREEKVYALEEDIGVLKGYMQNHKEQGRVDEVKKLRKELKKLEGRLKTYKGE